MPIETQNSFVGGLNDHLPAHKITQNAVQEAVDCDFSFDDVRSDTGVGGVGGGSEYFYEAGQAWIGTDGVGGQDSYLFEAYTEHDVSSDTDLGTPLIVEENDYLDGQFRANRYGPMMSFVEFIIFNPLSNMQTICIWTRMTLR